MDENINQVIYVGPTSFKLGLHFLKIYTVLPEGVSNAMEKNPALRVLLPSIAVWPSIREAVMSKTPSSVTHAIDHLVADGVL